MEKTEIMELYKEAVAAVTKDRYRWTHFLNTAARIYKLDFLDQLIIYEQDANVTACGTQAQWEQFGRHLKKGAKQIGILDRGNDELVIRYVFDVSETEDNGKRLPTGWSLTEDNKKSILDMLKIGHGQSYTDTMTIVSNDSKLRYERLEQRQSNKMLCSIAAAFSYFN